MTIRSPRERETTGYLKLPPTKPGEPKLQNLWLKAHIVAGTKTHVIPWVVVTEGHANDSPFLPTLVNQTLNSGFVLNEVYADKGYLSDQNYRAIGTTGATPYIAFKSNSRGRVKEQEVKTRFWKTVWHFFQSNPTLFFEHYYQRENVEAVFAAIKKKLGETLSSKDPVSQRNELLCKIISYNLTVLIHEAFEHGIPIPGAANKVSPDELGTKSSPEPASRCSSYFQSLRPARWPGREN